MSKNLLLCVPFVIAASACVADETSPTDETVQNLREAGFPADDIQVVDGSVYVGRDVLVTLEMSREMIGNDDGALVDLHTVQYTTRNLVAPNIKTICVFDVMGNATLTAGLNLAISRYNALGLAFTLKNGIVGCDATINAKFAFGPGGGVSGFPSNGRPFGEINIQLGTANFGVGVASHVIAHEIGHTIGFRHSDFFDRSISCGGAATNEGDGGVGAILVPGTPEGAVLDGSYMNSCFNAGSTGVFTSTDVQALQTVY
jgi:hypothetical protein